MKKIMLLAAILFAGVTVLKADYNPATDGWKYNEKDSAKLDAYIAKVKNAEFEEKFAYRKIMWLRRIETQKALLTLKENASFADVKKIILDVEKAYPCPTNVADIKSNSLPLLYATNQGPLRKWLKDIINDQYFASQPAFIKNAKMAYGCGEDSTKAVFQDYVLNYIFTKNVKDYVDLKRAVDAYERYHLLSFTKEENLENLSKLKLLIYPNISKGKNWEALAVKVELMLKANQ